MSPRALIVLSICLFGGGIAAVAIVHQAGVETPREKTSAISPLLYAEVSAAPQPQRTSIAGTDKQINLPILVYHIVRPSYPSDSAAVRTLALTPQTFTAEMNWLKTSGYHVVRFSDLEAYVASSTPLPSKPIILSFDDGWGDQFKYAFPILEQYHYPVTFFVFTNAINRHGFLTWRDLHALIAAGMTIGDHTRSHPYLARITSTSTLWSEIDGSKRLLEKKLGVPINEFAYPFGEYNPTILSLVKKAGYKSARGDYYSGPLQSAARLFELSALNAPTTTAQFEKRFP